MRKVIILIMLAISTYTTAQERYSLSFLTGFYTDFYLSNTNPGFATKGSLKYNVSNNVWLGLHFTQSRIKEDYFDLTLFREGSTVNRQYQEIAFDISNNFIINSKHILYPSIGLYIQNSKASIPYYKINQVEQTYSNFQMKNEVMYDLGLCFGFSYRYKIKSTLLIGVTTNNNLSLSNGAILTTFSILPCIEVKF